MFERGRLKLQTDETQVKHYKALENLDFKLKVGPRQRNGLVLRFTFQGKI